MIVDNHEAAEFIYHQATMLLYSPNAYPFSRIWLRTLIGSSALMGGPRVFAENYEKSLWWPFDELAY